MQKVIPLGKKVLIKEKEPDKFFKNSNILIPETVREKQYLLVTINGDFRKEL